MMWNFGGSSMKRADFSLALISALALAVLIAPIPVTEAQTYKVIHRFTGGKDGIEPEAGVLLGADGSLYGTTYLGGGRSDTGTVFKIDTARKETRFTFPGCCGVYSDGGGPEGDMVQDSAGNLYGTSAYGGRGGGSNCGNFGCGTIFKLDTAGKRDGPA